MKLTLKKIRWKNFLSTGNQWVEIELNKYKTLLIVGKNGAGKSTLLDALSFVLFSKPFRKIRKPQLVNTINNKDTVVEVEFTVNTHNFKVIRGIKPDIFEIFKDGELLTQTADNRDYQDAFEQYILKMNHRTFCQIVILGSAIFVPFMALPTPKRREVIEDLLDMEIFTKMNAILGDKTKTLKEDYDAHEKKKELTEQKYHLTREHLEYVSKSKEGLILAQEKKIKDVDVEVVNIMEIIDDLRVQISGLLKLNEALPQLEKKRSELLDIQTQLRTRNQLLNKEVLFLQNNEICPTCTQVIQPEFKKKTIEDKTAKSSEIDAAMILLKEKIDKANRSVSDLEESQKTQNKLETVLQEKLVQVQGISSSKSELEKELQELRLDNVQADFSKLEVIQAELADISKTMVEMSDDKTIMGYAAALLKDSGIKAKIVKTFIPVINNLIGKYLAGLDFFVEFNLDEEFNESILSRYRDDFSYESFSQGEKLRLDVALLFTWRAVAKLRSSIDINICILDEIFDGSADAEGVESIIELIKNMIGDNIIVISHKDQLHDKFDKVIHFEKIKNFSTMIAE